MVGEGFGGCRRGWWLAQEIGGRCTRWCGGQRMIQKLKPEILPELEPEPESEPEPEPEHEPEPQIFA